MFSEAGHLNPMNFLLKSTLFGLHNHKFDNDKLQGYPVGLLEIWTIPI